MIDDEVSSAPLVRQAISGGRISITMGGHDTDRQLHDAKRLADRLRPR